MWVITYLAAESRRDFDHEGFRMGRAELLLLDCLLDSIVMMMVVMMMIVVKRIRQMHKMLFYSNYVDAMLALKLHETSSFRYG